MDWITETVAIGNYLDARNEDLIREAGFKAAVSLDGTLRAADTDVLPFNTIATYKLIDGPGNDPGVFLRALGDLSRFARNSPPVLVQCHAGRSRSVVLVTAHLMRLFGYDEATALSLVATRRETALTSGIELLLGHV